jgi:hypothetical protein
MIFYRHSFALAATLAIAAACSDGPTAPPLEPEPTPADLSVITPFILPAGADWGLYFQSFNQTRSLTTRVIHYPDGRVTGSGYFAIPLVGSGVLRVTGAEPYGDCIPQGTPCDEDNTVPESAVATGTARFLSGPRFGQQVPFILDLKSTFWPITSTFDLASLMFCSPASTCTAYQFFGELTPRRSSELAFWSQKLPDRVILPSSYGMYWKLVEPNLLLTTSIRACPLTTTRLPTRRERPTGRGRLTLQVLLAGS